MNRKSPRPLPTARAIAAPAPRLHPILWLAAALLLAGVVTIARGQDDRRERDLKLTPPPSNSLEAEGPTGPQNPQSFALIVGVGDYKNLPDKGLEFTERDAELIYSILISQRGGSFPPENVHRLIGERATLENVRYEIEQWLPSVARTQDTVLIYFAGHGFAYEGKGYLAPYDFTLQDISGSGYPMNSLGEIVASRILAKNKILLTDACHSGAITPSINPDEENAAVNQALQGVDGSLFSLTASRDREKSFESPKWGGGHGIFTYYVVKGLEGEADDNNDGIITADEVAEYTRANVREATNNLQTPTSDRGSFDPNMPMAFVPEELRQLTKNDDSKYGSLLFTTNLTGVEVHVDDIFRGVADVEKPLFLPGLTPGTHTVQAFRLGYQPDGPREEIVYPAQERSVRINLAYTRKRNPKVVDTITKARPLFERGSPKNYQKALAMYEKATKTDPNDSEGWYMTARARRALADFSGAEAAYRKALEVDPDYFDARSSFGGMLLDTGNYDESIRQLNRVLARRPSHEMAHTMLTMAYHMKGMYAQSVDAGRKAVALDPKTAEPHFFLAHSLRMVQRYEEAKQLYDKYLALSDFQSSGTEQALGYWLRGFTVGGGQKSRASQKDIWNDLRVLTYFGLGHCETELHNADEAIAYFQKAMDIDSGEDPILYYGLARAYARKAELDPNALDLQQAKAAFQKVVDLSPHLPEAEKSLNYIGKIESALQQL